MFALTWWDLTYALFWAGAEGPNPTFWLDATFVGVIFVPTFVFTFAVQITQLSHWITRTSLVALFIEPFVMLAALLTDHWHGLFFSASRDPSAGMILVGGPFFWANLIYSYVLVLIACILLVQKYSQSSGLYRKQLGTILAGVGIPWLNSILFMLRLSPFPNADNTPFSFTIAGIAFAYALWRHRLLDVMPIARHVLIENMSDGVVVLDAQNRLVDINPAARNLINVPAKPIIGESVETVFNSWSEIVKTYLDIQETHAEIALGGPAFQYLDLQISPLIDQRKLLIGRLIVWRDITKYKQIQHELHKLATKDMLTQVFNRYHFIELANKEINRASRNTHGLTVVLMDIDYFKKINDTFGHLTGDQVLRTFAERCKSNIREMDIFARFGGEEFVLLLPESDEKQAFECAERLREKLRSPLLLNPEITVTASFGLSEWQGEEDSLESVLRRADQALYMAKEAGRDCVMIWNPALKVKPLPPQQAQITVSTHAE